MKSNLAFVIGIALIAFYTGIAWNCVGEPYGGGVHSQWLPLKAAITFGVLFYLGYQAGKEK